MQTSYSSHALVKDIAHAVQPYRGRFIAASLLRLTSDLAWLFPAYALAWLINFFTDYRVGDSLRELIIIALFDLAVSAVMIVFLVTFFTISYLLTRKAALAAHCVNVGEEELHGLSFEAISNIRSIKVLTMSSALTDRFHEMAERLFQKIRDRIFRFRSREVILNLWAQLFRLGTIIAIVMGILHGTYEVGFLVLYYAYFSKVWESIRELSEVTQEFIVAKYGISRMMDILNEPVRIDSETGKRMMPARWKRIALLLDCREQVSQRY